MKLAVVMDPIEKIVPESNWIFGEDINKIVKYLKNISDDEKILLLENKTTEVDGITINLEDINMNFVKKRSFISSAWMSVALGIQAVPTLSVAEEVNAFQWQDNLSLGALLESRTW